MYSAINRPHPFSLAAFPRTPPQLNSPPPTPLPVYEPTLTQMMRDPTPPQTSFLDLAPGSLRTSLRSRTSYETLPPSYPPPNYRPEDRPYDDMRHPFAAGTPAPSVHEEQLFGCPTVYAMERLPELEDDGMGYTPRRVVAPRREVELSTPAGRQEVRVQDNTSTTHQAASCDCQPNTNTTAAMTLPSQLPPTPQTPRISASAPKVYTASSAGNLSDEIISPKLSTVKWVRYDPEKRMCEIWVITRYRHSYEISRKVPHRRTRDHPGSTRTRLEFMPSVGEQTAWNSRVEEGRPPRAALSGCSSLSALDKAITRLRTLHDELDRLILDLDIVRVEMMADYEAQGRLRVKKRDLKDRIKVLERDVEVYLRVVEVLSEVNEVET